MNSWVRTLGYNSASSWYKWWYNSSLPVLLGCVPRGEKMRAVTIDIKLFWVGTKPKNPIKGSAHLPVDIGIFLNHPTAQLNGHWV